MSTSTNYWHAFALVSFLVYPGMPASFAASQQYDYQRYITFKNDFDFPIYPVIQVPEDNCIAQSNRVRRIIVNGHGPDNKGLNPGELLTVLIPNEADVDVAEVTLEVDGKETRQWANCWYRSGRVYIFGVDLLKFEQEMRNKDPNNENQSTNTRDSRYPSAHVTCFSGRREEQASSAVGNCYTGVANTSFAADTPAQLAEYTFDSDFSDLSFDPNKPIPVADTGKPMADIDVSHVDDIYLPIAASVFNNGATGYMGSAMKLDLFKKRINNFFKGTATNTNVKRWPIYSAYSKTYWDVNTFGDLTPDALGTAKGDSIMAHLPAGYNIINNTLGKPNSSNYFPRNNIPYLINGVRYDEKTRVASNPRMQQYIDRWMSWIRSDPCPAIIKNKSGAKGVWPDNITDKFDRDNFCSLFRVNVNKVWDHFTQDATDGFNNNKLRFYSDCGLYDAVNSPTIFPPEDMDNACIIQHIVGYNSKVLGGELPGRVQAALRSVAYDPDPKGRQYQYDPFLTFAAPYDSPFNLDPFTRLVHSNTDGVGAVAYSFSIDDKYGNFRDASSGFIIDAGGVSALENQTPFDPYQQYHATWGYNPNDYSLVSLPPETDLPQIEQKLIDIAETHDKRAILIRQDNALFLLAQTTDEKWTLTALATSLELQSWAEQEKQKTKGTEDYFQQLIDHTFGERSVFPVQILDVNAVDEQAIAVLKWNVNAEWNFGKQKLYDIISQKDSYKSTVNNWIKGIFCGQAVDITTAGSQTLAFPFANGAYQSCKIELEASRKDASSGEHQKLIFSIAPELPPLPVTDNYTGATWKIWGLPHGKEAKGDPLITHGLRDKELNECQTSSSEDLVDECEKITVSANWSNDEHARDTVYMGLDFQDMPRVNLGLQVPPTAEPDPDEVRFPRNARFDVQKQPDGTTANISWTPARIRSGATVKYELTLWTWEQKVDKNWDWIPQFQPSCATEQDQEGHPINTKTFCNGVDIGADSMAQKLSLVAINMAKPGRQSDPLVEYFIFSRKP